MRTVKVVVIGASGVGKTSLRGQYISGRFSTGYRATIGTDFISKTLPHPLDENDSVTLQIWDTAGQERFSGLSSAFFRGADAAILMFDVNEPETLHALTKWWDEFRARAPLADADIEDYCCVVVGNKMDLAEGSAAVSEADAYRFLNVLVPPSSRPPSPIEIFVPESVTGASSDDDDEDDPLAASQLTARPLDDIPLARTPPSPKLPSPELSSSFPRSSSIAIVPSGSRQPLTRTPSRGLSAKSRSRSSSRFYGGTMTTTHTGLSHYHTPSSSLFDVYQSARSSPEPWRSASSASLGTNPSLPPSPTPPTRAPRRVPSRLSTSSGSTGAVTITPSLFARGTTPGSSATTTPPAPIAAARLARGPALFFASAKTGAGVPDVFAYVARRVVRRWAWEDAIEARRMSVHDGGAETVRLGLEGARRRGGGRWGECCAT